MMRQREKERKNEREGASQSECGAKMPTFLTDSSQQQSQYVADELWQDPYNEPHANQKHEFLEIANFQHQPVGHNAA